MIQYSNILRLVKYYWLSRGIASTLIEDRRQIFNLNVVANRWVLENFRPKILRKNWTKFAAVPVLITVIADTLDFVCVFPFLKSTVIVKSVFSEQKV